jgi:hypothetical protein
MMICRNAKRRQVVRLWSGRKKQRRANVRFISAAAGKEHGPSRLIGEARAREVKRVKADVTWSDG